MILSLRCCFCISLAFFIVESLNTETPPGVSLSVPVLHHVTITSDPLKSPSNTNSNIISEKGEKITKQQQQRIIRSPALEPGKDFAASLFWEKGFSGKQVRIAILDTGISSFRKDFWNIREVIDFTSDGDPNDFDGHGTFVAGLIAGKSINCPGFAPNSELYIFKTFSKHKVSLTEWFIKAIDKAIERKVHIINLSNGGADYTDQLFIEKLAQAAAKKITIISAVGNGGPTFGTHTNPADLPFVIGVGSSEVSSFLIFFLSSF
eukprot:TRINITY_DN20853_c0_g1_i1.p1 TRINITY_DN20853_c0_g1~~TRINITY_DN20853_c0_g1_i1.p1  ORF type:complete len:263 (+),score=75.81 TRINITY_DN20853_c0_g1_i1:3-791(+)